MIYLASDHAGFDLKEKIKKYLLDSGYDLYDCGALEFDKDDDFPDLIKLAAQEVSKDPTAQAVIFGGSGQGEAIVANKYSNVRAVVFYSPAKVVGEADVSGRRSEDPYEMLKLTREHNNANVLSLGARFLSDEEAITAVNVWLNTPFSDEERHQRRVEKIQEIESTFQ